MFCNFYFKKISKFTPKSFSNDPSMKSKEKINSICNNQLSPVAMNDLLIQVVTVIDHTHTCVNKFLTSTTYDDLSSLLSSIKDHCTDKKLKYSDYKYFIISFKDNLFSFNKDAIRTFVKEASSDINIANLYSTVSYVSGKHALANYYVGSSDDGNIPAKTTFKDEKKFNTSEIAINLTKLHTRATNIFKSVIDYQMTVDNILKYIDRRTKEIKKQKDHSEKEVVTLKAFTSLINAYVRSSLYSLTVYKDFLKNIYSEID